MLLSLLLSVYAFLTGRRTHRATASTTPSSSQPSEPPSFPARQLFEYDLGIGGAPIALCQTYSHASPRPAAVLIFPVAHALFVSLSTLGLEVCFCVARSIAEASLFLTRNPGLRDGSTPSMVCCAARYQENFRLLHTFRGAWTLGAFLSINTVASPHAVVRSARHHVVTTVFFAFDGVFMAARSAGLAVCDSKPGWARSPAARGQRPFCRSGAFLILKLMQRVAGEVLPARCRFFTSSARVVSPAYSPSFQIPNAATLPTYTVGMFARYRQLTVNSANVIISPPFLPPPLRSALLDSACVCCRRLVLAAKLLPALTMVVTDLLVTDLPALESRLVCVREVSRHALFAAIWQWLALVLQFRSRMARSSFQLHLPSKTPRLSTIRNIFPFDSLLARRQQLVASRFGSVLNLMPSTALFPPSSFARRHPPIHALPVYITILLWPTQHPLPPPAVFRLPPAANPPPSGLPNHFGMTTTTPGCKSSTRPWRAPWCCSCWSRFQSRLRSRHTLVGHAPAFRALHQLVPALHSPRTHPNTTWVAFYFSVLCCRDPRRRLRSLSPTPPS
ncbi:hypothetical protein MIND_00433400 [Mycena indigotica]|uniref:Uncharacterized protein n=1 Tax=Mycena indigotica TaxID=2126181 RepID=A0A8H6W681_9AGAR|nr:uncharacterized protein MIND_00433400 [Mycena indigotica]KAF7306422.1 hypothetical protein MIND_00433400 [Mycena indigotica]